ncbi:unnamed protein product, partial [Rotaria socialis]
MLLGKEVFESRFDAHSVTRKTAYVALEKQTIHYAIFDIPGLIENSESNLEENKREIYRAFYMMPDSIIVFIFGTSGGRINCQDVAAFKAMNVAYGFDNKSLLLIVNNIPKERSDQYENEIITILIRALNIEFQDNVYFMDQIPRQNETELAESRDDLWEKVKTRESHLHNRKMDITLDKDRLKEVKKKLESLEEKLQILHEHQVHSYEKLENDVEQIRKTLEGVMRKKKTK